VDWKIGAVFLGWFCSFVGCRKRFIFLHIRRFMTLCHDWKCVNTLHYNILLDLRID
jgi:hypothetical protein